MIKDTAITILCWGDSNTWGSVPRSDARYARSVRWPGALQCLLGDDYEVVSEGLCGRTLVALDSAKPHRSGITHLKAALESADPVDYVIVMLGTNDVKSTYNLSAEEVAGHLDQTLALVMSGDADLVKKPKILVICPPAIIVPKDGNLDERMVRGVELFKKLPELYRQVASKYECGYINAQDHVSSSDVDGYHLDAEAHLMLAQVIKVWIQKI